MIIAGGQDTDRKYYNDTLKFDTTTETWLQVGKLTKARAWHAMSVVKLSDVSKYCV